MPRGPSYVLNSYIDMIFRNSSDGGKIGAESRVKLACKRVFVSIFTSDGHPMLPRRSFSVKKMSRLNCYFFRKNFLNFFQKTIDKPKNIWYYKRAVGDETEKQRPDGQAAKTTPSHGVNPGSIPGQVIKTSRQNCLFFIF